MGRICQEGGVFAGDSRQAYGDSGWNLGCCTKVCSASAIGLFFRTRSCNKGGTRATKRC